MIRKFFSPPVFEDEEKTRSAIYVNGVALFNIPILLLFLLIRITTQDVELFGVGNVVVLSLAGVMIATWLLCRSGHVKVAAYIQVSMIWLASTMLALNGGGIRSTGFVSYFVAMLMAGLLLGLRTAIGVAVISIFSGFGLAYAETAGIIVYSPDINVFGNATEFTVLFAFSTVFMYLTINSLQGAIRRANESENSLRASNKELHELNRSLEDRVGNRTAELEFANQRNEKRAQQFEAVAQVARATTANENLEDLLPRLTSLISDNFGFYHTGIFLLDEDRANAILSATNSEGGKRMLSRGHKLQVGQTGMVGFVSATGTPRIALDVGADAVFFDNPDLPNTRSEMALPLRIMGEIIGVLDVQSTEPNAFQQEDIDILSTLADQVSIAIQNARSFETMQQLLQDAQKTSSSFLGDAWRDVQQSEDTHIGYRAYGDEIQAYNRPLTSAHIKKAVEIKQTVIENGKSATLAIPIRLRDEVIGIVDIRTPNDHKWDEDEVDIAEAVADRLSLALETSLLIRSTQRRAELERVTAEISGKIGATTQFDAILRTAAEELSRVLGGSDVLVQIQSLEAPDGSEN